MNGRIYDPFLGRVLSADPLVPAPHDMQSFNRYSYVFNNPLSLTDPSGFLASGGWYTFGGGWQMTSTFYPGGVTVSARWVEGRSYYVGPSGRGRQTGRNTGGGGGYYGSGNSGSGQSSESSTGNPEIDSSTGSGWTNPHDDIYVLGREGTVIPPGEGIGALLEDYFPAAHTFATLHDAYVGRAVDDVGIPDWSVNVPSMVSIYVQAVSYEAINSLYSALNFVFDMSFPRPFVHSHPQESESNDD